MSSYQLASIPIDTRDGKVEVVLQWQKHAGYVVLVYELEGRGVYARMIEQRSYHSIPAALRGMARIVERLTKT